MEHCASAGTRQCTTPAARGCLCGGRNGRIVAPFSSGSGYAGYRGIRLPPQFTHRFNCRAATCVFARYVGASEPCRIHSVACTSSRYPLGSSSSSAVGEAPKLELSGSSGEMDPLGVACKRDSVQYRVMSNVRSIGDAASSLYEEHRGVALVWA